MARAKYIHQVYICMRHIHTHLCDFPANSTVDFPANSTVYLVNFLPKILTCAQRATHEETHKYIFIHETRTHTNFTHMCAGHPDCIAALLAVRPPLQINDVNLRECGGDSALYLAHEGLQNAQLVSFGAWF